MLHTYAFTRSLPITEILQSLLQLIQEHGLVVVFLNVLFGQAGMPVPVYPTIVVTGALYESGGHSLFVLVAVAVLGALVADFAWYSAGRRYGPSLLSRLCRFSLSPDACIQRTESIYTRYGPPSLMVAKFIPGFAAIASVLAGTVGTRRRSFLLFDGIGAALWTGSAVYLGSVFSTTVGDVLTILVDLGTIGGLVFASAVAAFIALKWWQRQHLLKSLNVERIRVEELHEFLSNGTRPFIIDVRSPAEQAQGRIPGAVFLQPDDLELSRSKETEIVVYCNCPNDASAAHVSRRLMESGFKHVRPLEGGIDAWLAAGFPVETVSPLPQANRLAPPTQITAATVAPNIDQLTVSCSSQAASPSAIKGCSNCS